MIAHSRLISDWSLRCFSINSCCLAGGILVKEKGLGITVGLTVGVADSEVGAESLGDVAEGGLVAGS